MIDSVAAFLHAVRRSGLLETAQLNEVKAKHVPILRTPAELAAWLVGQGWLTRYQADQLLAGSDQEWQFGPYRVLNPVGEGGLCQVFRAWHTGQHREVALKVVHPELRGKPEVLAQIRQELEVLARLDYPCFVKSVDPAQDEAQFYFAMEYVDGVDLHKVLKQLGPPPMAQACAWVRHVARGLQYAYEQGLVHRDIKPANLLVSFAGDRLWILDIGLARLEWAAKTVASGQTPTSPVIALMGTPDYIAPEQAMSPDQANIRADIYSLGCTFFHLLTGQPPFPGKSLTQKLLHHQQTPPPSVRDVRPELPQELAAVVQRMMAKRPEDRYQTPAGVAVALVGFCQAGSPRMSLYSLRPWTEVSYRPGQGNPLEESAAPARAPAAESAARLGGMSSRPERRVAVRRAGSVVPVLLAADPAAEAEPLHGWVLDRSITGLALLVDEPVAAGTEIMVRVDRPPVAGRWIPIRVVYCKPERASYRLGAEFLRKLTGEELRLFG
jgi:serine/threonine protein kinase